MNKSLPLLNQSISAINEMLVKRELSANQLCKMCFNRIEKTKSLNAFIAINEENAVKQSVESDERLKRGKVLSILDGIPIAFKDNICTESIGTTCGSKMLLNYRPTFNATVVEQLVVRKGSVLAGKTNLDEYAMGSGCVDSIFGPTINPWKSRLPFILKYKNSEQMKCFNDLPENDWYISGGSSGGSAVAVATGAVFGALSSDTGGSTRNPAARNGIIGFKPTYGLVSRYGLIPLTHSMDVIGIMARTVDDVSLILASIAGHDCLDSTTLNVKIDNILNDKIDLSKLKIGIPEEYLCEGMSSQVIETWKQVSDILSNSGCNVQKVSLPNTKYSISCYSVLNCCEVASNFSCYDGIEFGHRSENCENSIEELYSKSRQEGFSETVKGRIFAGNYFLLRENYEKYFNKSLKVRRMIANDFDKVFYQQNVDLLLTPVTLTETPLYSEWVKKDNRQQVSVEDYCTQPVNMAGLPAVSIPCKVTESGLPISLQLIGTKLNDFHLLSVAKKLEHILDFPTLIFNE